MSDKNHTICIVDDDPSVCKALSRVIRTAGFNVISCGSPQELLDDKELGSIDLLVLDIKMPVMNGFALQDHIAASGLSIPYIFMSAHDVDSARTIAIGKNAVAFLQKPFDEKDLLDAINRGLSINADTLEPD